jgi:dTDP-4-dehydrorhamnose reductase
MTDRVLIAGAAGQLGLTMAARWPDADITALTRADLDVTSPADVRRVVDRVRPAIIVNCSAYTDVDGSEREPATALAVNAWGVHLLARAAAEHDATLIHFSTDFVFDGRTDRPYTEEDAPNPQGAYAASKLVGEWLAAESARAYVLRVESLFGGPRARSSVDRILASIRSGAPVRAFSDRTVSPSYVEDVARATVTLVSRQAPPGLYHCVNSGWTTWSGLARELATIAGRPDAEIVDVRMADAGLNARRPQFAALSNAKLDVAGVVMPTWQDALRRYAAIA